MSSAWQVRGEAFKPAEHFYEMKRIVIFITLGMGSHMLGKKETVYDVNQSLGVFMCCAGNARPFVPALLR